MPSSTTELGPAPETRSADPAPFELQLHRVASQIRQIGRDHMELLGADRLEQLHRVCDTLEELRG